MPWFETVCFYTNETVIIQLLRISYLAALLLTSSADQHSSDENWVRLWQQQKTRLVNDSKNVFSRRKERCPPVRASPAGLCLKASCISSDPTQMHPPSTQCADGKNMSGLVTIIVFWVSFYPSPASSSPPSALDSKKIWNPKVCLTFAEPIGETVRCLCVHILVCWDIPPLPKHPKEFPSRSGRREVSLTHTLVHMHDYTWIHIWG